MGLGFSISIDISGLLQSEYPDGICMSIYTVKYRFVRTRIVAILQSASEYG